LALVTSKATPYSRPRAVKCSQCIIRSGNQPHTKRQPCNGSINRVTAIRPGIPISGSWWRGNACRDQGGAGRRRRFRAVVHEAVLAYRLACDDPVVCSNGRVTALPTFSLEVFSITLSMDPVNHCTHPYDSTPATTAIYQP